MAIKYESILQLLTEADVNAIHQKYYADIPIELLLKTIQADPTSVIDEHGEVKKIGDYVKWLLKFRKQPRYEEDLGKVKEWLLLFDNAKKAEALVAGIPKDINKLKNFTELWSISVVINSAFKKLEQATSKRSQKKKDTKNIIENQSKVFKVGNWTIATPLTHASACYWGADTAWCTAVRPKDGQNPEDASETFDHYSDEGPLYVLRNNVNGERFQFHFESQQFMDVTDDEIDIIKFLRENRDVFEFFWNAAENLVKGDLNYIEGKFYVIVNNWLKLIELSVQPGSAIDGARECLKQALLGEKKTIVDNTITKHLSSEVYNVIINLNNKKSTQKIDWNGTFVIKRAKKILETSPSMADVRKVIIDVWNKHIDEARNKAKSFLVSIFNENDHEHAWRDLMKEEDGKITIYVCDLAGFQLFLDAKHRGYMDIKNSLGIFRFTPAIFDYNDEIVERITRNTNGSS